MRAALAPAVALLVAQGCAGSLNYVRPAGPRFAGAVERPAADPEAALRVVTFNVAFAAHVDRAVEVLRVEPGLRDADVVLLQEMDEPGTQRIAAALGMYWVYYPAVVHPHHRRDFGNAILARWPIENDRKIVLPHRARLGHSQRIAVAGTVRVNGVPVRLYSLHLALPLQVSTGGRREQAEAVLADALGGPECVVVGGDLNGQGVGEVFARAGFSWPTRDLGHTARFFDVDHLLVRGLRAGAVPPAGIVKNNRGASDHRPVWGVFVPDSLRGPPAGYRGRARKDPTLGIPRAAWLEPGLLRGGSPGQGDLETLKARGFRTIVNLGRDEGERRDAERAGLDYFEIPLTAHLWSSPPTEEQLRRFFELTLDPARRPLYFHCRRGQDRTGTMAALYRIEAQGWAPVDAEREMQAFGYHDWYRDLIGTVRSYLRRGYPAP